MITQWLLITSLQLNAKNEYLERNFPENFKFGVSTAAYQIEGAWNVSDKTESIWDRMSHTTGRISDGSTGDIACDSYHKYIRDVEMIKEMNLDFYRFSISWNRLLPDGRATTISEDGLRYYNDLIDKIIKNGIIPYITIYHFDLPQKFQDIGGWENPDIADYFAEFAEVAFDKFGDRVKHWVTVNEPARFCELGYGTGADAPEIKNSGVSEYKCGHNVLRGHAKAYRLYKMKAETEPHKYNGKVGIALNGDWYHPETGSVADQDLADTYLQFETGWFAYPIFKSGNYPNKMLQKIDGNRLPKFTDDEMESIKESADFLGINHYTTSIAKAEGEKYPKPSRSNDMGGIMYQSTRWPKGKSTWLRIVPWGFKNYLKWLKNQYNNPEIIIFENGYSGDDGINDPARIAYINKHINSLLDAVATGSNITGYGVWSLMDNFEWKSGFTEKFGLYHVDFNDPQFTRTPRASSKAFAEIAKTKQIVKIDIPEVSIDQPALLS